MISEPSVTMTSLGTRSSADERELAEVLDRYLAALEADAPLDVDALTASYPRLADQIRALVSSVDMLHVATREFGDPSASPTAAEVSSAGTRRLGDFELGPEIGRGGMGVVYEARQISLRRKVALKVLPFAAMWDQKQVARFQNEAQAAAQLHHPNIVPVFAVGQERGVHFYAMQFIEGQSLEQLVRQLRREAESPADGTNRPVGQLSTIVAQTTDRINAASGELSAQRHGDQAEYCRAIARLGVQAAGAVHYAHELGVVHRDIKPSNMLVDRSGKLWITDFGLARVQNSPGVTVTGDIVGTLRYMSPEQAAGQHALVDLRSDVYGLGASLYELLTLQAAFPGDDRQGVLQAIAQREPVPPRQLNAAIPVDLETIVLSAMAKSRDERYATAEELADDLNRFLEGKATHAHRPTIADHASKWVRRHRTMVAVAALFLVVLSVVSTIGAVLVSREHVRTQAALAQSQRSRQQARQVVDRFGLHFSRQLAKLPGSAPLQQALLSDTLAYYREFIANSAGDPALTAELAKTHFQVATIASRLGDQAAAQESFEAALALFAGLADAGAEVAKNRQYQATCLNNLGLLLSSNGDADVARQHYRAAVDLLPGEPSGEDREDSLHLLAEVLTNQGLLERQLGDHGTAAELLTRAIDHLQRLVSRAPDEPELAHALAIALNNRSFVEQQSDWPAAERSCHSAIALLHRLVDQSSDDAPQAASYRNDLALCLNNLAAIDGHQGDHSSACTAYRQAIAIQEQLVRQAPAVVQYRGELAVSWNNLGQSLIAEGDAAAADEAFARGRRLLTELVDDYPAELRYRSSLAGVLNNRAMAHEQRERWDEAIAEYEAAIEHQCRALDQSPHQVQLREFLSKHYFNYGRALRRAGRAADAVQAALERRALWPDDGEHLIRVAEELAAAADLLEGDARRTAIFEAAATCRQAADAGYDGPGLDEARCRDEIEILLNSEP